VEDFVVAFSDYVDLLIVVALFGQRRWRRVGVAFTGKTAARHPKAAHDVDKKHRDQAQQRRQRKLAERGDTTPVCD
jgi:hypothetical protein